MKTLITILAMLLSTAGYGQKLARNEVDKFTKSAIKETSYDKIAFKFSQAIAVRARSVDGRIGLWVRLVSSDIHSVSEGSKVTILLENDKTVDLVCTHLDISQVNGSNSYILEAPYSISAADISKVKESAAKGIRIYYAGNEYEDFNKIRPNHKWAIKNAIEAVE